MIVSSNQEAKSYIKENVSRETFERFCEYEELLKKWNKAINLVSPKTIDSIWLRHFLDSYQLLPHLDLDKQIFDIGSGAGFPGLILSFFAKRMTLIESDQRKCSFLRNVSRETNLETRVLNDRIETIHEKAEQITSRALADLTTLFELTEGMISPKTKMILLKGEKVFEEIAKAETLWHFNKEIHPSITSEQGYILILDEIQRRDS